MIWNPMIFTMFVALTFALFLTIVYVDGGLRSERALPLFTTFFVVIWLSAWAAALWIGPAGPLMMGVAWIPVLLVSLLVAFSLVAFSAGRRAGQGSDAPGSEQVPTNASVFLWGALIFLLLAIVGGYLAPRNGL